MAPVVASNAKPNIFNVEQEQWLGNVERDNIEAGMPRMKDASLSQHLQDLVDRLVVYLPQPHVAFHAVLVDSSEVNGWSIAGGNIYITRKLAATVKSDDELASVLGHEIGHIAAHQFAFETTERLRRLLNVTSVGDESDVRAKYQKLTEVEMRDKHPPKRDEDTSQDEADLIGVYLTASAGFRAAAFPEAFDREFYVEGKTGSKFLDLFGITKPDQKRLRGMLQMVTSLPPGCDTEGSSTGEQVAFDSWRARIVANQKGTLVAVAAELTHIQLQNPLQMEINRVEFSPDGKYLLAQDSSSVYAIDVESEKELFRMDADHADTAYFSPDSKMVTFITPGLHTERWDVAGAKLREATEPTVKHACAQTVMSPDGRTVLCASLNRGTYMVDLSVLDSRSGEVVWTKENLFEPSYYFRLIAMMQQRSEDPIDVMSASFSSDGNTVLIGPGRAKIALDLRTRTPIKIGGPLQGKVSGAYAFIGNDRVAGVYLFNPKDSGIYSFPDGKEIKKVSIVLPDMSSISDSGGKLYVKSSSLFGRNTDGSASSNDKEQKSKVESRVGLVDLEMQRYVFSTKSGALDVWKDRMATQNADGKVVLGRIINNTAKDLKLVALPDSRLGGLLAVDSSPDGRYLAFSTRDRSGVWDLTTGARTELLKPFSGAHWTSNTAFVAEFEKNSKQERQLVRLDVEHKSSAVVDVTVSKDEKDFAHMWYRSFAEWKKQKGTDVQLLYHNLDDGKVLWTKDFPDGYPRRWTQSIGGQDVIFSYLLNTIAAKTALNGSVDLHAQAAAVKKKEEARLIDVVDGVSGNSVERMVLDLPADYEGVDGLNRVDDQLYVTGTDNRTLVYSMKTGKRLWQAYGKMQALDRVSRRVCLVNRSDEAVVYDASGKELGHTHSGTPIRYAEFEKNGARLLMLGADQVVALMDVGGDRTSVN